MAVSTYLSTIESKNKLSKQEQRQNHGYGEYLDGCQMRAGCQRMAEWLWVLRSTNR